MSNLENRLGDLFAKDSRIRRVRTVNVPRQRSRWLGDLGFVGAAAVLGVVAILMFNVARPVPQEAASPAAASPGAGASNAPAASADEKGIVVDGQVVLAIDDDQIVQWFRTESQLCDSYNIDTTPTRRTFCTEKSDFKNRTEFASVIPSPDEKNIGFTIKSDALAPDSVAGFFDRSTGRVSFLTGYYLSNEFISFSPSGTHFVYRGNCFESRCALYVRDSATLSEQAQLNKPIGDERTQDATFVRWISENELEYRLGGELRTASF